MFFEHNFPVGERIHSRNIWARPVGGYVNSKSPAKQLMRYLHQYRDTTQRQTGPLLNTTFLDSGNLQTSRFDEIQMISSPITIHLSPLDTKSNNEEIGFPVLQNF